MAIDFNALKKQRGASNIAKIAEKLAENESSNESYDDERYWKLSKDKSGNGSALIRFLPPVGEEGAPWIQYFSHGFKGATGRYYIEKCLTTLNKACPCCDANTELWNTGEEANKNIARNRKRKLNFVSSILVIKDPKNPENEGKVFLFRYGKKIYDQIQAVMFPEVDELEDDAPESLYPFCPWEGADFKLVMRKVDGYPNYDKSSFAKPAPLHGGDDDAIKEVWEQQLSLEAELAPENFKSYDDLQKQLDRALGVATEVKTKKASKPKVEESVSFDDDEIPDFDEGDVEGDTEVVDDDDDELAGLEELLDEE